MNREVHVRFCEGPRAKLPRPTHPYVAIQAGFVYVAVILDAWSRKVVGYAIARSIDVRLTLAALRSAIDKRRPPPGCVHHTDRGSQYAAGHYRQALAENGLVGSMGRRGNPYDNAKGRKLHEDAQGRGRLSDGLRDLRGCRCRPSAVHRSHLQRKPTALRARLSQSAAVRGSTRPAHGQNRSLILSTHKGALHGRGKILRDFFDSERSKASKKRTKQVRVKTRGS